jgi:tetratricopeptide (TPR) repeat protein
MMRRSVAFAVAGLAILAVVALAQTAQMEGTVIGDDGNPIVGAVVKLARTDVKQTLPPTKTDKKGHFIYMGMAPGSQWTVTVEVAGKDVDTQSARASLATPVNLKFDLAQIKKNKELQAEAMKKAVESGDVNAATRGMSAEQRDEFQAKMKENEATMRKNKELMDTYSAGMTAMEGKRYAEAIADFEKGATLDAKQPAVWLGLADAYMESFKTKKGADKDADVQKCLDAYAKALEINPDEAAIHNNLGRALAEAGKNADAQSEMNKAAQLDPPGAGKYYYNLGAILVNSGQSDAAAQAFQKAIAADPNYGDAYYQYGVSLMAKAEMKPDGTVVPAAGTIEAFQKCIDLGDKCSASSRQQAKDMIDTLKTTVQNTFTDPNAKKSTSKKK